MRQRISLFVGAVAAAGFVFFAGPFGLLQSVAHADAAMVVHTDGGSGTASLPGDGGTDW